MHVVEVAPPELVLVGGDGRETLAAEAKELMGKLRAYWVVVGYEVWLKSRVSESRRQRLTGR